MFFFGSKVFQKEYHVGVLTEVCFGGLVDPSRNWGFFAVYTTWTVWI